MTQSVLTADTWKNASVDFSIPENFVPSINDSISIYCNPYNNAATTVWYDDLSLVPYYKISYNANGGSGVPASEYVLADTYTVKSTAAPTRKGFMFKGWALTDGAVSPVSSVTLSESDVTLYAVWEKISAGSVVSYSFTTEKRGVADGIISLVCDETLEGYTNAELYFADDSGILSGYTCLASLTLTDGTAAYVMSGNRAFPKSATRICAVFKGENLPDSPYWYTISADRRFDSAKQPLFTYYNISDSHVGGDYWSEIPVNRRNAVNDIIANSPDFVVLAGDLVDKGLSSYYEKFDAFMNDSFRSKNMPVFLTNGNHEFFNADYQSTGYDYEPLLSLYSKQIGLLSDLGYEISRDGDKLYYSAMINGCKFIFLSMPERTAAGVTYSLTDEQLIWLDEQLYDCEKSNVPAFIVSHVGIESLVPNVSDGIVNEHALLEVLSRHPNVVMSCGHSHSYLDSDENYVRVGDMTSSFTHFNDGCIVWLDKFNGTESEYFKEYSAGQYIEVYDDMILISGRKFASQSEYISKALYVVELPDTDKSIKTASISGQVANGSTLTALLDGIAPSDDYTCTWYVGGQMVCTGNTYKIEAQNSFGGFHVALRITASDGTYSSCLSEDVFEGYAVKYDLNGGTGTVPAQDIAIYGMTYTPYIGKYFPKKYGMFFIGWSTDKDAAVPMSAFSVTSDVTMYAVYSDKPSFTFDANLSGWNPNASVAKYAISDGKLIYTNVPQVRICFSLFPVLR